MPECPRAPPNDTSAQESPQTTCKTPLMFPSPHTQSNAVECEGPSPHLPGSTWKAVEVHESVHESVVGKVALRNKCGARRGLKACFIRHKAMMHAQETG